MLIGISGKAGSGKDQMADFLMNVFDTEYNKKFIKKCFADDLKSMCKEHFGLDYDQMYGNKKEVEDTRFMKYTMGGDPEYSVFWTPREIMQSFGEFYRSLDCDFWVRKLNTSLVLSKVDGYEDVIIPDVRHINEAEYIKKEGGFLIRINRKVDGIHNSEHISEIGLDNYKHFDIDIDNNSDLDKLKESSKHVAKAILFLHNMSIKKGVTVHGK